MSSVLVFLNEVLRRRFFADRQSETKQSRTGSKITASKITPETIGKPEAESYEIVPLDRAGREAALAQLAEFAADDFLIDFKKWHTPEDWSWLIEKLSKSEPAD